MMRGLFARIYNFRPTLNILHHFALMKLAQKFGALPAKVQLLNLMKVCLSVCRNFVIAADIMLRWSVDFLMDCLIAKHFIRLNHNSA